MVVRICKKLPAFTSNFFTQSQSGWGSQRLQEALLSTRQAGPCRAGCLGPCPHGFLSPGSETPQPPWATCVSANLSSDAQREPPVSVYACCLWSCHWALLKRAWLCLTPSLVQYLYTLIKSLWAFLSPGKRVSALLCSRDASVSSSAQWPVLDCIK